MFVVHTRSLATANVRSCPTTVETCSCRFILLSFHETRAREVSLSLSSHRLAKQNVARSDGRFPSSPRVAALFNKDPVVVVVMDQVPAWSCWMRMVDEDQ